MKMPWLFRILAALVVFGSAALAMVEVPLPGVTTEAKLRRFCPGCFTVVNGKPMEPIHPSLEDVLKEESIGSLHEPIEGEPLQVDLRTLQLNSTRAPPRYPRRKPKTHLPGSFSVMSKWTPEDEPSLDDHILLSPSLQTERIMPRPLDSHKVALRTRREERKVVASMRRRGKQPGSRPVCRGCFSGLMLTGRPAQGGAEKPVPKSFSQSGEDSSGGD